MWYTFEICLLCLFHLKCGVRKASSNIIHTSGVNTYIHLSTVVGAGKKKKNGLFVNTMETFMLAGGPRPEETKEPVQKTYQVL